jgi:signal transduction histidine kinase
MADQSAGVGELEQRSRRVTPPIGALGRLRWQLTLSHLAATTFTLICLIAAAVLFGSVVTALRDSPRREPAQQAQAIALAIGGLAGGDPSVLNGVLSAIVDGRLRLLGSSFPPGSPMGWHGDWGPGIGLRGDVFAGPGVGGRGDWRSGPGMPWRGDGTGPPPRNLAYAIVLGRDGQVIASSDSSGSAFAPPERGEWGALAAQAQRFPRDPEELVVVRQGPGPAALAAYPVVDQGGQPGGTLILAQTTLAPSSGLFAFLRSIFLFVAATVAVLFAASLFALASASLLAYLLARRLVGRLERLGQAAEALAAGDLALRVDEGSADEVGQLARRFNLMAGDLERSLHQLQAERDRVAGLLDAQRQLVANVSHELRTPVATLRGYLESALRDSRPDRPELPAPVREDLETMDREMTRLQRLIDELFALSRAAVGRLDLRMEPTDVAALVRRLVETAAPLAWTQRRVQVISQDQAASSPALADAHRLEQVVSNLLSNAIRHTPPGGLVAAEVKTENGAVLIEVRDTGEGIPSEDLPHIFERFYRGHAHDGLARAGLGLALVKELAEAMGGSVAAASAPGEGSSFSVRLPRLDE